MSSTLTNTRLLPEPWERLATRDPVCTFPLCWDEPNFLSLCFAPKGVDSDREEETLLGMFSYNVEKDPMQTFPLKVCSTHRGQMPGSKTGLLTRLWQGRCGCFLHGQRVLSPAERDLVGLGGLSSTWLW